MTLNASHQNEESPLIKGETQQNDSLPYGFTLRALLAKDLVEVLPDFKGHEAVGGQEDSEHGKVSSIVGLAPNLWYDG